MESFSDTSAPVLTPAETWTQRPCSLNVRRESAIPEPSRPKRLYKLLLDQLKTLAPFLMIVVYSVAGAFVFMALEREHDSIERRRNRERVEKARHDLQVAIYSVSLFERTTAAGWNRSSSIIRAIESFERDIGFIVEEGESVWHFYNALFYSGAIYTTIGYGNIVCKTTPGRITTIFYAILGIPLTLSVLNQLGNLLLKLMTKLSQIAGHLFCSCCAKRSKNRRDSTLSGKKTSSLKDVEMGVMANPDDDQPKLKEPSGEFQTEHENDPPLLAAFISTVSWLFICAAIFCFWEEWDYFTAFYFFFVSLSTVGFGDIVPAYPEYMIINVGLVFIGLALVSVTINAVQQKLEDIYMSILAMLLNEYLNRLSDTRDGKGASIGMIQSWALSRKATYLVPLLSKSKRKLVMQRFQEEAKAQGIELPPTLTDLDPGTGLPNILTIDNEPETVEHFLEQKEQQPLSRPRLSQLSVILATTSPSSPTSPFARDFVHASCQTDESSRNGKMEILSEKMKNVHSQSNGTGSLKSGNLTHSLSVRDSGCQTLAMTTDTRSSQTFNSGLLVLETASQTDIWLDQRFAQSQSYLHHPMSHSQTSPPAASNVKIQTPLSYFDTRIAGSQTSRDVVNESTQTLIEVDETGSQVQLESEDAPVQAGQPFFLLRNEGSQTRLDVDNRHTQTWASSMVRTNDAVVEASVATSSAGSQTSCFSSDVDVQTGSSIFDTIDRSTQMWTSDKTSHRSVGVQTGASRRSGPLPSRRPTDETPASSSSSTARTVPPLFRQVSMQTIPPPHRRPAASHRRTAPIFSPATDQRASFMAALRPVPTPAADDGSSSSRQRLVTGENEHLASVNALVSEFESRRVAQPQVLDLHAHFPYLRRPLVHEQRFAGSRRPRPKRVNEEKAKNPDGSTSS